MPASSTSPLLLAHWSWVKTYLSGTNSLTFSFFCGRLSGGLTVSPQTMVPPSSTARSRYRFTFSYWARLFTGPMKTPSESGGPTFFDLTAGWRVVYEEGEL